MPSQTVKDFLLYLCVGGIIMLSINTFLLIENQTKILENQNEGLPIVNDTNKKINEINGNLALLMEDDNLPQETK
jgi:hypothetical protein